VNLIAFSGRLSEFADTHQEIHYGLLFAVPTAMGRFSIAAKGNLFMPESRMDRRSDDLGSPVDSLGAFARV
jgi:hypothetical protein